MARDLSSFERIARIAFRFTTSNDDSGKPNHPFETRNIHPMLPSIVRKLFDDGHFAQATFEAFKFIDKEVARLSNSNQSGFGLMMAAFPEREWQKERVTR